MKNKVLFLFIFMTLLSALHAQHPQNDPNWQPVFEDNFNTFNSSRWYKENMIKSAGIEGEDPGCYLPQNVNNVHGKMILTVKRDTIWHGASCHYFDTLAGYHYYSSASVVSCDTYRYGYFEIRAKLPVSDGYWPAFWFWAQNDSPNDCWYNELDVVEGQGCYPDSLYANVHWDFTYPFEGDHHSPFVHQKDLTNYHWYGLEWDSVWVRWYYDRELFRIERNNWGGQGIQHPMHIILSVSLNPYRSLFNNISANTILPNYMYIDQANVYKLKCDCNTTVFDILDFSSYQYGVKKRIILSGLTILPSGGNICLRAAEYINLTNGFEVPLGTEFYADVNPCP